MESRRHIRRLVVGLLTGALTVSTAWAGIGLAPVSKDLVDGTPGLLPGDTTVGVDEAAAPAALVPGPGQFLVGSAKISIEPDPGFYGAVWEKEGCATMDEDAGLATLDHVADFRVRWPERVNCIYSGGYGIGPMNPITAWDQQYGLWVRTIVISDGTDEVVLSILDGTSYMGDYKSLCNNCGAYEIAHDLDLAKYQFDPAGFMLASTHSHTAPDFISGWGGVPAWYMQQVHRAIVNSVGAAFRNLQPAVIQTGEVMARQFSGERRDFYHSAEDNTMSWLRATNATSGATIATMGAFAAHPVTADESLEIANADFPGPFNKRLEERFGGVGLFFQTGLGNMSPRGSTESMGNGLAALIPATGTPVVGTDVSVAQTFWDQPITNIPLGTLGAAGFFDRPFVVTPAVVDEGENGTRRCRSASPLAVHTAIEVAKVGNLRITGAPGETFANISNTLEERNTGGITFALAQVNDGLGYIMQSFETDHAGRQGLGFVGDPLAEYEDAYSIDACFGDAVLEKTLARM
jgi:hypothetical protein